MAKSSAKYFNFSHKKKQHLITRDINEDENVCFSKLVTGLDNLYLK